MSERGFLPFTTVGFLLLLLTIVVLGQFAWVGRQSALGRVNDDTDDLLLTSVASVQNDLERAACYSLYEALWEVSRRADSYTSREAREDAIESLAGQKLERRLSSLAQAYEDRNSRARLALGRGPLFLELRPEEGGYVSASVELPGTTRITARLPDNSLRLTLPYENFETFVDSRFYLLDGRVEDFVDGIGKVLDGWKYAEYALAYGQAWLGREVVLSEPRSRALFQLGWASHELSTFGSFDYPATSQDLSGIGGATQVFNDYNPNVVVEPVNVEEIQTLIEKIDASLEELRRSEEKIRSSSAAVREVRAFDVGRWADQMQAGFEEVEGALDASEVSEAERRFHEICENFELTYSYTHELLDEAATDVEGAQEHVREARAKFQQLLDVIERSASDNPVMRQLHEDLVLEGEGPALTQQVSWGVSDTLEKLNYLEGEIGACRGQFEAPDGLIAIFPDDLQGRFTQAVNENFGSAREVLDEARKTAGEAIHEFEIFMDTRENLRISLFRRVPNGVQSLLQEPGVNWLREYEEYPEPGEDPEASPATKTVDKYVLMQGEGSIGGLRLVLRNTKSHFDRFEELTERFESLQGEMSRLELDEGLREALTGGFRLPQGLSREQAYEIAPPEPINPRPGLSVFHEFEIEDVNYERWDPCGWSNPEAPPTPIYLWFIGVTIYWAQWEVTLELEGEPVEEVFDYDNPSLPRPMLDGSNRNLVNVHKPLAYCYEVPRSRFSFHLVLLSLRPFGIRVSD
ncbi:MAG: hypothetical protein U9M97_04700 [Candidatus Hadarchaeota archaeon]|nr:hypothetical protein [Candidatus Hadarchaeota archaeon]